jgi:hypothetical protein
MRCFVQDTGQSGQHPGQLRGRAYTRTPREHRGNDFRRARHSMRQAVTWKKELSVNLYTWSARLPVGNFESMKDQDLMGARQSRPTKQTFQAWRFGS